jgi:hypothetical protein
MQRDVVPSFGAVMCNHQAVFLCWVVATLLASPVLAQTTLPIERVDPPRQEFYSKQCSVRGIRILAHADVSDAAMYEAARRIGRQIGRAPQLAANLATLGVEMHIIGKDQECSDLPEYRHMKGKLVDGKLTFDQRGRGYGGFHASCAEENLLKLPSDRYRDHRDICSHEFAHTILQYALSKDIREKVEAQRKKSIEAGKWKTMYAAGNAHEFFAELTMWYFDSRGDYGKLKPPPQPGSDWLRAYDPEAFALIDSIYTGRLAPPAIKVADQPARPAGEQGQSKP